MRIVLISVTGFAMAATLALTISAVQVSPEIPQSLFNEANYYLEQQRYQDAAQKYRAINELGYESGPLYLNLGISYTHLDSLGLAKFYYLKALEYRQTRNVAEDGITYVDLMLGQVRPNLPVLPVAAFYDRLYFEIGSYPFFLLSILLINIAVAFLIISWVRAGTGGWLKTIAILVFLAGLVTLAAGFYVDEQSNRYTKAVLVYNDSIVRAQPFIDAPVVASAHIGYTFTVDTHISQGDDNWLYVRLSNGLEGWIPKEGIRIL